MLLHASGALAEAASTERQELPLTLEWSAPPDCPSRAQVRAEVERIVRARPGFSLPALSVDAQVLRTRNEYRVHLELTRAGETTRRDFQSESCHALLRAATLTIALSFGDGADISETNPAEEQAKPEPAPTSSPPAATAKASSEPPAPSESSAARRHLALGLGGAWSPNAFDGNSFAVHAAAALRWPSALLTWTNRVWLPRTTQPTDSESARFWAATTSLAPGLRHRFGALELELAFAVQVGLIHGAGAEIDSPAQAWAPWYALAPCVGLGLELGRGVRVALGQEFVLTPVRPEFEIEPIGTVYRLPVLTPVTTLNLQFDATRF